MYERIKVLIELWGINQDLIVLIGFPTWEVYNSVCHAANVVHIFAIGYKTCVKSRYIKVLDHIAIISLYIFLMNFLSFANAYDSFESFGHWVKTAYNKFI